MNRKNTSQSLVIFGKKIHMKFEGLRSSNLLVEGIIKFGLDQHRLPGSAIMRWSGLNFKIFSRMQLWMI